MGELAGFSYTEHSGVPSLYSWAVIAVVLNLDCSLGGLAGFIAAGHGRGADGVIVI